ncbi:MAG: hypothetical protein WA125_16935 [Desulfosporosinus sp.]
MAKLINYTKGLVENFGGDDVIIVNKLLNDGFSEQIYIGEAKLALNDENFISHQNEEVLTITGGAGECLSVLIDGTR